MKRNISNIFKIILPLLLGGAILYWMYRGFDFHKVNDVLFHQMNWTWMILSFPFGILAQAFRGWRWQQTLAPMHEYPRRKTTVYAVFLSYAVSLIVPRMGEFTRCGVLKHYDGVSFPKAIGTVVTERIIDSLLVLLIAGITFLSQIPVFMRFFAKTGTRIDTFLTNFSAAGWAVTFICGIAVCLLVYYLYRRLAVTSKIKSTVNSVWQGIVSLRNVRNVPLFLCYTLGIWASYFLHYYLTFFCFTATASLSFSCAMVTFIVGSIAVIVPTPNGAGPWHFAVKTMLMLYGVAEFSALNFVLIVHSIQTLLVVAMGIYAWIALLFMKRRQSK